LEADTYIICVWVNSNPSSCYNKNPDQSGGQPIVSDVTKYACLYEDLSTEKDIYASWNLRKQKTQIPGIKQFQVKREEQNAVCQYGSLLTCLYPCGATTI
jgi:hypothetical protein